MNIITENTTKIKASIGKISKKLEVFYNPVMKLNRDVSILLLNSIPNKDMQIGLPLSGSGIRGIRFLKELKKGKIKSISFNDYDKKSIKAIKKNLKLNDIGSKFNIENKDANDFLLSSTGFDYIDIDPFGSPNLFLDSSVKRLSRRGILAVTATDTAALAGSSANACIRKYWAKPLRNEFMHETAVRILIRKIQLIGAQNEKALIPIFSYYSDHYYKIFFRCDKGKLKVDKVLKNHSLMKYKNNEYGPIWIGKLWDEKLVNNMFKKCDETNKKMYSLLKIITEEAKITTIGSYDLHEISRKIKKNPRIDDVIKKLKNKGFIASRTHFNLHSVKSNINYDELILLLKN